MILVVFGTRPEALKLAPVVRLAKSRGLPIHVHCTMQSPDLVDQAILPWDSEGSLLPIIHSNPRPRLVVVQGDTRTAFETAVMAYELGLPIFYVESGIRTYDLDSPWPEEGYRQMISRIATYHACTTEANLRNLYQESPGKWFDLMEWRDSAHYRVTGSPIVESVRERAIRHGALGGTHAQLRVLVTLHRRENRGHFSDILCGIKVSARGLFVEWPMHPNGWATQEAPDFTVPWMRSPMSADLFTGHLCNADVVVTDSGGVQEEAQSLKIPAVICRTTTDRPENIGKGAFLAGVTREGVTSAIREALAFDRTTMDADIFGDGKASERIVSWWAEIVG